MAKLDEIAALLVEEINGFEKSVDRLELLKKSLHDFKIRLDTTDIDFILKRYNDHQKQASEKQRKQMADILYQIKRSILFPKWLIKLFWGLLVCIVLTLGFSVYKVSRIPEREEAAFKKGENKAVAHFRQFFEETPEAGELYKKWSEPQNKE
ncbi:MAG: DUF6730 family protein [Saonia sp.]